MIIQFIYIKMFTLRNVFFSCNTNNEIVFIVTHKSNHRDFISYEKNNSESDKYISSVLLTQRIEINLILNKYFKSELSQDVLYNVSIAFVDYDKELRKNIYKITKIAISLEKDDEIEEVEEQILDSFEIETLFKLEKNKIENNLKMKQDRINVIYDKINNMEKSISNINLLAEISSNFEKYFEKNYI